MPLHVNVKGATPCPEPHVADEEMVPHFTANAAHHATGQSTWQRNACRRGWGILSRFRLVRVEFLMRALASSLAPTTPMPLAEGRRTTQWRNERRMGCPEENAHHNMHRRDWPVGEPQHMELFHGYRTLKGPTQPGNHIKMKIGCRNTAEAENDPWPSI